MKKIIAIAALLILSACTDPKSAERALDDAGFSDVKITGYNWFSCSKDDFYHTGFIAKNSKGKEIRGTVCGGLLFKNSTIRFE